MDCNGAAPPYFESMMNLLIGLCFGMASAAALIIMWRLTAVIDEFPSDNSAVGRRDAVLSEQVDGGAPDQH